MLHTRKQRSQDYLIYIFFFVYTYIHSQEFLNHIQQKILCKILYLSMQILLINNVFIFIIFLIQISCVCFDAFSRKNGYFFSSKTTR